MFKLNSGYTLQVALRVNLRFGKTWNMKPEASITELLWRNTRSEK